jgi:hypothetical protein
MSVHTRCTLGHVPEDGTLQFLYGLNKLEKQHGWKKITLNWTAWKGNLRAIQWLMENLIEGVSRNTEIFTGLKAIHYL